MLLVVQRALAGTCNAAAFLLFISALSVLATARAADVSPTAIAQTPRTLLFSHISDRDEAGEAPINAIAQDHLGYLWYGTQEGLKRFDGDEIVTYEHRYDEAGSLANDWVWTIYASRDGTLWIGTEGGGLDRYDRQSDSFIHYRHNPADENSISSDRIRVIYEDRRGVHWIGTDGGGLNRFDPQAGVFTHFRHDADDAQSLSNDRVLAIREDRGGNLWIGTNGGGLSRLDRASGQFTQFRHDPENADSLSDDRVRAIFEDRDGRLWVGTYEGGLNLFDPVRNTFQHFRHDPTDPSSLSNDRVRDIYEDHNGALWIGTDGGLNEWRPDQRSFARYLHDATDSATLSDNRVTTLFQDRGGVLWVGTYNGLNSWNYLSDVFTYYQSNGTALRLSSNIITAVEESRNRELWVGTYGGGLNRIAPDESSVTVYRQAPSDDPAKGLPNDRVMSLYVDQDQSVWIGTRGGGLSRLDTQNGTFQHFVHDPANPDTLSSNNVTSMLSAAHGSLWVGTYGGGLNLLDTRSGRVMRYRHDEDNEASLGGDNVLALHRDRSGQLWVGTEYGGLNRFDEAAREFQRIRHSDRDPTSLSADSAWALLEGSDGSLWIGTNGGGLNRWAAKDRAAGRVRFTTYRKPEGLRSDTIQALLEDNGGHIWISSNRGLLRMDPEGGSMRYFSRNSGLKGSEFNFAAKLRSRSGRLLFGGTAGLVAFQPSQVITNRHKPEIVLGAFNRLGPVATRYSVETNEDALELDYRDDLITFEFAGLDFAAPDKNQYRYKLQGFDENWSEARDFRRATYTNLPAGDYSFVVQAANNDGIWNEQGVSMNLLVVPPPWLSPWAYAAYLLLILGIVAAYMRMQKQRLALEKAQRVELEAQVAERTEELAQRNDELLQLNEQIKESSWTDSLTGLKNRRFLDEFVDQEVAIALRRTRELSIPEGEQNTLDIAPALAFIMIDLDGFKNINDDYGHQVGDDVLVQVRDILTDCCRKSDTIIRWGGDEFLIIGRNTSNRAAEKLAERIRVRIADHQFQVGDGEVARMSGSIGFAVYPFSPLQPELASWDQVWAIADQCAYIAKDNGRNAWVGVFGNRDTSAQDIQSLGHDLERLLGSGAVGLRTSIEEPLVVNIQRRMKNT